MYYPESVVEEIRQKNDVVDIISGYVSLKRQGRDYVGLCPFHNEKSPSFSVSPSKQMYYCFGCHKGGDVFKFVCDYENFTYPEAIKYLGEKAGVALPEVEYTAEMREKADRKTKLLAINKDAAIFYYARLRDKTGETGMRYFKERELSPETMKSFGLGYALAYSDGLLKHLKSKGYSDDIIKASGLVVYNEKYGFSDKFINRVMFPIQDINHKVIGFGGRVLGDAKPKYLNSPETEIFDKSRNLYGMNFARTSRKDYIILCEGYMDVIAMHQAGFTEAVASLGTAFTPGQAMLIKRYAKDVYLSYDSDNAGVNAALRAIGILREAGLSCKIINMNPYKDPDEFMKNLGKEEFQKRIDDAENSFLFEVRILRNNYNLEDPDEKTRFHTEIAKKLCQFEDEIQRENYLEAVARKYEINPAILKKSVLDKARETGIAAKRQEVKSGIQSKETKDDGIKKSQRLLLTWLVEEPKLYNRIKVYISPEDFTDPLYEKIAAKLFVDIENESINPAAVISMFEDEEQQNKAAAVFNTKLEAIETGEERRMAFHDLLVNVKRESFRKTSDSLGSDVSAITKVVEAKQKLQELERTVINID